MKKLNTLKITSTLSFVFIYMLSASVSASPYIYNYIGYHIYNKSFGDRGVDTIIATPPSSCPSLRFRDVKIKVTKKRYGNASIIKKPITISKCKNKKRCAIKVKWAHKAAGIVEYQLKIKWVKQAGKC